MRNLLIALLVAACAHAKPAAQLTTAPPPPPPTVPDAPPTAADPAAPSVAFAPMDHFGPIYFDYDAALVRDDARPMLHDLGDFLAKNPGQNVTISGHTDERGTEEYNIALGDERARSAKMYLVRLGVPAERVSTISYGKGRPANEGTDEDAYRKNRRDEFELSAASAAAP
jgi:peptidoglycan-associated lipoprotein